jgi:hypothetical protein
MAKNLKQLREKAATKGPSVKLKEIIPPKDNTVATQRFIKKHVVAHHEDPAGNGDDVYNASNIKPVKRSPEHGYDPGQDEEVYEEVKSKKTELTPERHAAAWLAATPEGQRTRQSFSTHMGKAGFATFDTRPFKKDIDFGYKQVVDNQNNLLRTLRFGEKYEPEGNLVIENKKPLPPPEDTNNYWGNQTSPSVLERARIAAERASTKKANQPPPVNPFAGNFQGLLKYQYSQNVADLTSKIKAQKEAARAESKGKGVVGTILRTFGLSKQSEQVLTNLYNTLNEENREKMIKLMESEEGFIKLVEFAVEKGID